ncbi:hypothetical protein FA15DRAFT_317315 [Coprinopsis marcescibilis]|uniref:Uncharacterized protein n=1 Tax=Coprinopsis marcescibilis TaxID=230819 RepID=A0A5C3KC71_COPMA|nr:hypothetical protein FA15DRAFT_317315 [Coprinopsis marcescibilis]
MTSLRSRESERGECTNRCSGEARGGRELSGFCCAFEQPVVSVAWWAGCVGDVARYVHSVVLRSWTSTNSDSRSRARAEGERTDRRAVRGY